jgi:hypothetical protein
MGLYPWFLGFLLEGATLICPSPIFLEHWALPDLMELLWNLKSFNLDSIFGNCTKKRDYLGLMEKFKL